MKRPITDRGVRSVRASARDSEASPLGLKKKRSKEYCVKLVKSLSLSQKRSQREKQSREEREGRTPAYILLPHCHSLPAPSICQI